MTNHLSARKKKHAQTGMTLMEMLVYLALSTIIVSGVIAASYPLITGAGRSLMQATTDGEAAFLMQKVIWLLSTGSHVRTPSSGASGTALTVSIDPTTERSITLSGNTVFMTETISGITVSSRPLLSSRVSISHLTFTHQPATANTHAAIVFSFDANERHFGPFRRFMRK